MQQRQQTDTLAGRGFSPAKPRGRGAPALLPLVLSRSQVGEGQVGAEAAWP